MFSTVTDSTGGLRGILPDLQFPHFAEAMISGLETEPAVLAQGAGDMLRSELSRKYHTPLQRVTRIGPSGTTEGIRIMGAPPHPAAQDLTERLYDDAARLISPHFMIPDTWTNLRKTAEFFRGVLRPGGSEDLASARHVLAEHLAPRYQAEHVMRFLESDGRGYLRLAPVDPPGVQTLADLIARNFPELSADGVTRMARDWHQRIGARPETDIIREVARGLGNGVVAAQYGASAPLARNDSRLYQRPSAATDTRRGGLTRQARF